VLPPKQRGVLDHRGHHRALQAHHGGRQAPAGRGVQYTEAGNGELGFYIVSDGSGTPYRVRVRPPCFFNLQAAREMIEGDMIADIIPTFGSINMIGGECDPLRSPCAFLSDADVQARRARDPLREGRHDHQAAWRQGIEIPHYCWHPGLSVAANCRMCLVEIRAAASARCCSTSSSGTRRRTTTSRQKPKLQPACQQTAAEGMVISSESAEVKQAQAAVQEFLLLNHPVDCPICDQAGECKLQDYWLSTSAR
jgi:hypothetical protein